MTEHDDIKWLEGQQPPPVQPGNETTSRVRADLLAHAESSRRLAALPQPAVSTRGHRKGSSFFGGRRTWLAAAAAAVLVIGGVTAAVASLPSGSDSGPASTVAATGASTTASTATATATLPQNASLVALATRVAATSAEGDATLVLHTNALASGKTHTGADLYLDDGRYYSATEASGLPAAAKGDSIDYDLKPALDAAAASADAGPQVARAAFLKAIAPLYYGLSATSPRAEQDNRIWVASLDALSAAYGRPDVLSGILKVLSTVEGVTTEEGSYDGRSVLSISLNIPAHPAVGPSQEAIDQATDTLKTKLQQAAEWAASHPITDPSLMTVTVDDQTGALLLYKDQGTDATSGVTITYEVSRVSAADYDVQ